MRRTQVPFMLLMGFLSLAGYSLLFAQSDGRTLYLPEIQRGVEQTPIPPTDTPVPTGTATSTVTPTSTSTHTPEPVPTAGSGVVILDNATWYTDSLGVVNLVGEVRNERDEVVQLAKVTGGLYSGSDTLLGSDTKYVSLKEIPPGEKSCFRLTFSDPPATWTEYAFSEPQYFIHGPALTQPGLVLLQVDDSYDISLQTLELTGQVRNDGDARAEFVRVTGTLYSPDNRVIRCQAAPVAIAALEPGQIGSFEIAFIGVGPAAVGTFRLQVEGDVPR